MYKFKLSKYQKIIKFFYWIHIFLLGVLPETKFSNIDDKLLILLFAILLSISFNYESNKSISRLGLS